MSALAHARTCSCSQVATPRTETSSEGCEHIPPLFREPKENLKKDTIHGSLARSAEEGAQWWRGSD
eukprot:CAMPEP_0179110732 /NCGR_PEP_ID=MMETSP0796-20121207/51691_1 /TAXON_ID=73915 /ORGANISM="Pyrodinium bahamense, Strain pbaha01" /LENGTH=65 /DNA_ID=CAMNT_0020808871 /DNA_START=41 /DNA_END=235 /DNA_ORIENTATION=+